MKRTAVGLVAKVLAWRPLREGAEASLNVKGAYLEVRGGPRRLGGSVPRCGRHRLGGLAVDVATAHLVVADEARSHAVLDAARAALSERWRMAHAPLQLEPALTLAARATRGSPYRTLLKGTSRYG